MLSEDGRDSLDWTDWATEGPGHTWRTSLGDTGMSLLEPLVRALSRAPDKIDRIAELVERLERTSQGQRVLPDGFEQLWEIIIQTRSELQ